MNKKSTFRSVANNYLTHPQNVRGITLISLVITIIVLLILAGVAVSMALDEGDLFAKSNTAKTEWNAKVEEVNEKLSETVNTLNYVSNELDTSWIKTVVTGTVIVDGIQRTVTAPIPEGFTASDISTEDEIAEGLVIYQGTERVSTDADAITTRNQFVWIPVYDINSMIMCTQNAENSICNIVRQTDGSLKCMTHHADNNDTELCGRLYGVPSSEDTNLSANDNRIFKNTIDFTLDTQTYLNGYYYNEPFLVTGKDDCTGTYADASSENYHGLGAGQAGATLFQSQLKDAFKAMAESVAANGGFYIGRYEAGYDSTSYTSKKGQTVMNASNDENKGVSNWYGLYNHLKTTMGSLKSNMIWGCQWDAAIKFIKQNKGEGELDPEVGHPNIGLKADGDVSGADGVNDIMKNIYDLEGNYQEYTAEAKGNRRREARGYNYSCVTDKKFKPASNKYEVKPEELNVKLTSRPGLYL